MSLTQINFTDEEEEIIKEVGKINNLNKPSTVQLLIKIAGKSLEKTRIKEDE